MVGIIVPWNSPVALLIRSLAPALAAGNTVAVKMPGQTALVANLVSQILAEARVAASRCRQHLHRVGQHRSPVPRRLAGRAGHQLHGKQPGGSDHRGAGAATLKRMNLELGGKTPMVVFDDADLDSVVPLLAAGITTFSGQFCMTGSRILVQRGVADDSPLTTRRATGERSGRRRYGPEHRHGSLIDKPNVARVNGVVEAALAYAKPIVRGGPTTEPALAAGAFYRPTLLEVDDVTTDIVQKEVFGPVATFEVFDTEDDAIRAGQRRRDGPRGGGLHEQPQHQQPGQSWHQGRHGLDEHLGSDQRRLRRGRLQAERGRTSSWTDCDLGVPRSQDRCPLCPVRRRLTRSSKLTRFY